MSSATAPPAPSTPLGPYERLALVVLAGLGVLALAVWAWGGIAGLVFGSGWPPGGLGDQVAVLGRLPHHLSDPAQAWPRPRRAGLPGPAGFYAAFVLLVVAAAAVTIGAVRAFQWARTVLAGDAPRAAKWASSADVRGLAVRGAQPGRVTLGRVGGQLVAAEPLQSAIALAPTQSRKTSGLAVPAILEWPGPVVATSVKTDLVRHTLGFRRQLGQTAVFDPAAVTGLARVQWTPLTGCEEWGHAQRTARRIAEAVRSGEGENARFWAEFGAVYLAPLLLAAARAHLTIADVARWVREFADPSTDAEVLATLEGAADATEAASGYRGIGASDHRMRSSLAGTAIVALAGYADPLVRDSSQRSDITPGWLLDGPNTLYLCAPEDEQERLEPLFVTLLGEIISEAYRRAAARGGPLERPLLLVLDELANVAAIPNLHRLAATGAGQGIQLVSIVQDLAQLVQRYGRERARTIVNNHRARWIGAGTADPDTLDYVARILGEEEIRHVSTSTSAGDPARAQRTESTQWRTLAPGNVLRERAYGTGVLIYGNLPPARLALRTWQDDRQLRARAKDPATSSPHAAVGAQPCSP